MTINTFYARNYYVHYRDNKVSLSTTNFIHNSANIYCVIYLLNTTVIKI